MLALNSGIQAIYIEEEGMILNGGMWAHYTVLFRRKPEQLDLCAKGPDPATGYTNYIYELQLARRHFCGEDGGDPSGGRYGANVECWNCGLVLDTGGGLCKQARPWH